MSSTNFKGFGSLKEPFDLLQKIKHDFERLRKNPSDEYAAFDFFVTSYHMLDWLHQNHKDPKDVRKKGSKFRDKNLKTVEEDGSHLLQICSHIANGVKHFKATRSCHKSVSDVQNKPGVLNQGVLNTTVLNPNICNFAGLFIYLDGEAAKEFGSIIGVIDLAKKILDHWESDPRLCPTNS